MTSVTSFEFDDLHMDLLGNGLHIGGFTGTAHIDEEGAICEISFEGVNERTGKSDWATVTVPPANKRVETASELFLQNVADYLYGSYANAIEEALIDWRESRDEGPEYEAPEAA